VTLFPDEDAARREHGYFCPASLPRPGERVYVLNEPGLPKQTATVVSSQRASQASLYSATEGQVLASVPAFDSDCSVTVRYDDGTTASVSAAEQPTPIMAQAAPLLGYGALAAFLALDDAWGKAEERHESLLGRLAPTQLEAKTPPLSGDYWGGSEESDSGDNRPRLLERGVCYDRSVVRDQAVRTTINFGSDGTVTGRGSDSVDGAYRITRGRWGTLDGDKQPTVAWVEAYDEGFEVAVQGRVTRDGKIKARFTSSRDVSGTFVLALKPSVRG